MTGIYFYNTQIFVRTASNVVFDNITCINENQVVGGGVGVFSVREGSTYVTVKNSYFRTEANGGHSTLVLADADYCTFDNNTIEAYAGANQVGNLIYLTTYNVDIEDTSKVNQYNNITNNVVSVDSSMATCYGICICGSYNLIENNTVTNPGGAITTQWGSGTTVWDEDGIPTGTNTYKGNIVNGGYVVIPGTSNVTNNTFNVTNYITFNDYSNITNNILNGPMTFQGNYSNVTGNIITGNVNLTGQYYNYVNNTFESQVIISGTYSNFTNNIYNQNITISKNYNNFTENTFNQQILMSGSYENFIDNIVYSQKDYSINVTGSNNNITGNYLVSDLEVGDNSVVTKGSGNIVENNTPIYTSLVINNDNYSQYFDDNGELKITQDDFTEIILADEITDKKFVFTKGTVTITQENENTQPKGITIVSTDDARVIVRELKINNTGYDVESAIIFESSNNNVIYKCDIYQYTETSNSMLVVFEGDNNKIYESNVTIYGISGDIDYSSSPQMIPTVAIAVFSSGNIINRTNVTAMATVDTSSNGGSIATIIVQPKNSRDIIENNTIVNNNITIEGIDYVYGILIFGDDAFTSSNNNITNDTIKINGGYSMGIGLYAVSNTTIASNTISINGTTNETGSSYNSIQSTTAGIVLENCGEDMIINSNSKINISNGVGIIINNVNGVTITSNTFTSTNSATLILNSSDDDYINSNKMNSEVTGILLEDSTSNTITFNQLNSTGVEYTIVADSTSTENIITNNTLRSKESTGDYTVNTENSDNTVKNNDPSQIILTNDNYSTYFDENGVFNHDEYGSGNLTIIIGEDLYNTDMLFNLNVTVNNPNNYTIYDSTITLNDSATGKSTNLYNLNINVTDGRESVIIINNQKSAIANCTIYQYNQNTAARTIYVGETGSLYNMTNNNITTYGAEIKTEDGTPSLAIIYEIAESPVSYTTRQVTGTYYIEAIYSDGEGITAGIYSSNRDKQIKIQQLNLTVIGDNCAIGTSINLANFNTTNISVTSNNEAIGYRLLNISSRTDTALGNSTITVSAPNNAIGIQIENIYGFTSSNLTIEVTSDYIATGMEVTTITSVSSFTVSNITMKVTSNDTATGIHLSDLSGSSYKIRLINIEVSAPKTVGIYFTNAQCAVSNSTITVEGTSAQAIKSVNGTYLSYVSTALTNNTITVNTVNSTVAVEFINTTRAEFINNTLETNSNSQYIITVINCDDSYVTYNNISRNGKLIGDPSVYVENGSYVRVENNPYSDPVIIITIPDQATVGSTITLTATISLYEGTITDGYIVFKVNGKTLKDEEGNVIEVPVIDGVATYEYTVPATTSSVYTVSAIYSSKTIGVTRSENVTIEAVLSTANIDITMDDNIKAGQTITLRAYITDENGNKITSGKVVFKLNGVSLRDAEGNVMYSYVDENGYATLTYTIPDTYSAKDYTLTAVFQATGYERTETNTTLTITKTSPTIQPDLTVFGSDNSITITQGTESIQVKATIIDPETQAPITTTTVVTIKINDKTVTQAYVSNGQIDMTIYTSSFRNPSYTLTIVVGENTLYNRVSFTGTITVISTNSLANPTSYNGTLETVTPNGLETDTTYNGTMVSKD